MSVHTIEDILVLATNIYRELLENKIWSGIGGSANITCFQFNKEGHEIKDCREDIESKSNKDWIRTRPVDSVS